MPESFKNPSPEEIRDCFLRFVFGYENSHLAAAVRTAYGDLSRTLHGIAEKDPTGHLREDATHLLCAAIEEAASTCKTQESFDKWHEATCSALQKCYAEGRFDRLYVGQAQKWVNMAIKYVALLGSLLGDKSVPGSASLFAFGHVPIDSQVISVLSRDFHLPKQLHFDRWSRIGKYDEYMEFQNWVREEFKGSRPLAVEFHLWQKEMSRARIGHGSDASPVPSQSA